MSSAPVIYKRGDIRRVLCVALALHDLESPSLNNIAKKTGHHKQTILDDIERLQEQLGVVITKEGSLYRLTSWGPVLKGAKGIAIFLNDSITNV